MLTRLDHQLGAAIVHKNLLNKFHNFLNLSADFVLAFELFLPSKAHEMRSTTHLVVTCKRRTFLPQTLYQ